ncbi:hypothetical protein QQF64_001887 [Cirrhinus molitorella]|uniref:Uncharacterized protein n=1 Tax=Cirrhinus molitorella TaxID=172907 RepID=A0ABR3MNM6_9TELE
MNSGWSICVVSELSGLNSVCQCLWEQQQFSSHRGERPSQIHGSLPEGNFALGDANERPSNRSHMKETIKS